MSTPADEALHIRLQLPRDGFTLDRFVLAEPRWSVDASNLTVTPGRFTRTETSADGGASAGTG